MLTDDQQAAYAGQRFVRIEGFADITTCDAMLTRVVELVHRADRGVDNAPTGTVDHTEATRGSTINDWIEMDPPTSGNGP